MQQFFRRATVIPDQIDLVVVNGPYEHLALVPFEVAWRNFVWMFFPIFKSERDSVRLLVPTYPDSEIDERVRCGEGEEGIYD